MGKLDGKRALVTGAAQGLGAAITEHLAEEGCDVMGWDVNADAMKVTANHLSEKTGRTIAGREVDVTDPAAVRHGMEDIIQLFGRLNICVCNAGVLISGDSLEFDVEKWRRVIDVNLVGYFITAREAARTMLEGMGGSIVQINSKSGKRGSFKNSAYAASKFGGIGVTQSLALEYAERGVRVNAVCPGNLLDSPLWVESLYSQYAENHGLTEEQVREKYVQQVPMKRGCNYRDVSNVVIFLASDEAGYMTGQAINVTGGQVMT